MIAFFDLEGPLSPIDHAADAIEMIGKKLGREQDFYQLFKMISLYDDELFLVDKRKDYWPGDTLKLIAPIIVSYATQEELTSISEKAPLTPGADKLFHYLHKKKIPAYIISTSYTQHAHTIAKKLHHRVENVFCTLLDFSLKPDETDILQPLFDDIFPRYLQDGLKVVKSDLDNFFFEKIPNSAFGPLFEFTVVCGGKRKKDAVMEVLDKHDLEPNQAIAVGDSITDIQMLEYIQTNKGTAISFNGNEHSLRPATIAFSGKSIAPLQQLFEVFPKIKAFVQEISKKEEEMKENEAFYHNIEGMEEKDLRKILALQLKYRKILREKAAQLT
jgi:energy-converting hydrogenase A subunit R